MATMSDSPPLLPQVMSFLTSFAPLHLAESWDNVGLLVEPLNPPPIKKALLTIDLTEDVMDEAVAANANLIISYHPPIFQALKRITGDKWKERLVSRCLENKIALFSPHTSWDAVKDGLSDWLASPFDFAEKQPILKSPGRLSNPAFSHHVNVFSHPPSALDDALECERILNQNGCKILSSSKIENQFKFQAIAQKESLSGLEASLNNSSCIYNIYERVSVPLSDCGTGRVGKLKAAIKLSEAVEKIKKLVNMPQIRIALEKGKTMDSSVESVAVVAGSGASVLRGVRADLYVTGEMLHHDILDANHCGSSVVLINHSDSERGYLSCFAPLLSQHFSGTLDVIISQRDRDPINIV
ncbi:NIF3-like protein 1 isoform X2 [Macrosteles quadrilineatus]|nr:NIF3-like protein 1 isoform X2 [Macrosteles quadrilineatus]XP_054273702.1 NIF3-like protein 1 isoform X2 [Macrosteles quadrilineatus]